MRTLVVEWQRLVDERGKTCVRCDATDQEIEKAVCALKEILKPSSIDVRLVKESLTFDQFKANTLQSNEILIAGQTLEAWLEAGTGHSKCCDVCGDAPCRTVELPGKSYETIPAELIVRAGLRAASQVFGIPWPDKNTNHP